MVGWAMARAYPLELRERAVAAVIAAGQPQAEAATLFDVALATLKRWLALWHADESLEAKRGKPGPVGFFESTATQEKLRAQVAAAPDDRLEDHCRRWRKATGQRVSRATMGRAIVRLGWTRKKSIS